MPAPSTSVIVASYDQARALLLQLAALAAQSVRGFDVIVADDGSQPPAREAIEPLRRALPFAIDAVWQPDEGFRKARALNLAAARSDAELLLFLDGDCLPFRNWVETYQRAAVPGEFCVGSYLHLDAARCRALTPEAVARGEHERALDWRARLRTTRRHWSNVALRDRSQTRPRIRGGNFAVDAALFRRVDGFDEVYCGYGREDSDLRNRMRNAGARGRCLWHRCFAVHLARELAPSAPRAAVPEALYAEGRGRVRARIGLSTHAPAAARSAASSASAPRSQSKR